MYGDDVFYFLLIKLALLLTLQVINFVCQWL